MKNKNHNKQQNLLMHTVQMFGVGKISYGHPGRFLYHHKYGLKNNNIVKYYYNLK